MLITILILKHPEGVPMHLLGRQIVVVDNLEPAIIRGQPSEGMLLAAQDAQTISVLVPDRPIREGSKVR